MGQLEILMLQVVPPWVPTFYPRVPESHHLCNHADTDDGHSTQYRLSITLISPAGPNTENLPPHTSSSLALHLIRYVLTSIFFIALPAITDLIT